MSEQNQNTSAPLSARKCIPCEGGVPPLSPEEAQKLLQELKDWMLVDDAHLLTKEFSFKDFNETMAFVNKVAEIAEEEQHHPDLSISYNRLTIELSTHAIQGLSENDFILAAKIDTIPLVP